MRLSQTVFCTVMLLLCSQVAASSTQSLLVQDAISYQIPGTSIETYVGQRGEALIESGAGLYSQGEFKQSDAEIPNFGLTDAGIWLKFSLLNKGVADSLWVLDAGVPFLRKIKVWTGTGDLVVPILSDGRTTRFHDRKQQQRILVTKAFPLVPNQLTDVWIYFESDSTSSLPLRVYPAYDVYKESVQADVPLIVFYAVAALFLVFVAAFAFALSSKVAFYYAGFFGCVLAYNAQLTGTLFMYLWPGFPEWNAVASHPFGMGAIIFALLMGGEFIKSEGQHRSLRLLVQLVTLFSAIYVFAPLVLPLVTTKKFAGPIVLTFLVLQVVLAFVAFKDKLAGSVFYVLGALVLFGYIGLFTVLTQGHVEIAYANKELMIRYGQLVDGFIFCVAIVRQTWLLRDDARQSKKIADASQLELATTRHDLRQPLHSLKLALESSSQSTGGNTSDRIRESLEYLEALVRDPSVQPVGALGTNDGNQESIEHLKLSNLFDGLRIMFADEASSKRIDLRIIESTLIVEAQPVHLLRVLANLISNAISHSGGTRILLGVRKTGQYVSFHCIDNGEGINPTQFEHLKNEFVKSESSSGEGLGLNIVSRICEKNGWRFLTRNNVKRGTHLIISDVMRHESHALG